jgi:hypothetical protein
MAFKWAKGLSLVGAGVLASLIGAFHIWHGVHLLRTILYVSSPNLDICNGIVTHLFSSKPIAPPPGQSLFFEFCLVVATAVELFLVGWVVDFFLWLYRRGGWPPLHRQSIPPDAAG